ncbi:hypothetical protein B296_00056852 [Ensete ventricosum]|uniref:Uncharacterized protein n=1 Tax=Ensete ventricosum TaxID=4639 RepID=A0A426WXP2_ENSVE|nr:hypothetical protein B296_00056852 [Ensete ventricosum]
MLRSMIGLEDLEVYSDLSPGSNQQADGSHHHRGRRKVSCERRTIGAVQHHQRLVRAAVEKLLVRVKQPFLSHKVPVVAVVELVGCLKVVRRPIAIAASEGTVLFAEGYKARVDIRVTADVGAEGVARRLASGVATEVRGHVSRAEALDI